MVDPDDRELTISCGAALLNLRVALRRLAYRDDAYNCCPTPPTRSCSRQPASSVVRPPEEETLLAAIGSYTMAAVIRFLA